VLPLQESFHRGNSLAVLPSFNVAVTQVGTRESVFLTAATVNGIAVLMAIFILRPMLLRALERDVQIDVARAASR